MRGPHEIACHAYRVTSIVRHGRVCRLSAYLGFRARPSPTATGRRAVALQAPRARELPRREVPDTRRTYIYILFTCTSRH